MSIKTKVGLSLASIAMGAMATVGGTFAYFSDEVTAQSSFSNGTLNLQPEEPYLESFELSNWKPGDVLEANNGNQEPAMILNNQGSLPMNVFMKVDVSDNLMKENIIVDELHFGNEDIIAKYFNNHTELTLAELEAGLNGSTTVNGNTVSNVGKYIGYLNSQDATSGKIKGVKYVLRFKDTGQEQNNLQGLDTTLDFTFTGLQYEGTTYDNSNLTNNSTGGGGTYEPTGNFDIDDRSNEPAREN
ncbi:hypothetical protein GLW05_13095 [Pontibacillus yanchengensis]|uniref:Spore coat protein n=1 Tax=Pontibacillus yanchengensis TaxID=462910 RepID=A0A6I5A106_9BACI|nr:TasA family protein [Pontibacillus yanchengensis]MYL34527.1 hypothetical protein [Pontibacillus yanchengensis]